MKICCLLCLLFLSSCSYFGYTLVDTNALQVQAKYTDIYVMQSNEFWKKSSDPKDAEMVGIGERLVRNVRAMVGEK